MENKNWTICKVCGYVVACDPGIQNFSSYPRVIKRKDLKVGMNLCSHNEDLPVVTVRSIHEDHIVLNFFGSNHRLYAGDTIYTPHKGLSYAYSEANIKLTTEDDTYDE